MNINTLRIYWLVLIIINGASSSDEKNEFKETDNIEPRFLIGAGRWLYGKITGRTEPPAEKQLVQLEMTSDDDEPSPEHLDLTTQQPFLQHLPQSQERFDLLTPTGHLLKGICYCSAQNTNLSGGQTAPQLLPTGHLIQGYCYCPALNTNENIHSESEEDPMGSESSENQPFSQPQERFDQLTPTGHLIKGICYCSAQNINPGQPASQLIPTGHLIQGYCYCPALNTNENIQSKSEEVKIGQVPPENQSVPPVNLPSSEVDNTDSNNDQNILSESEKDAIGQVPSENQSVTPVNLTSSETNSTNKDTNANEIDDTQTTL